MNYYELHLKKVQKAHVFQMVQKAHVRKDNTS
jgi:hypothetical protein